MNHKQEKLENPVRLAELNPVETLKKIGIGKQAVVCDIGAGSGIFTIPAAKMTKNTVFALELNVGFLQIINEKAKAQKLLNIVTKQVTGDCYDIHSDNVDTVLLVTVLHEIENKEALFTEIERIMKSTAQLAIIEFHKEQTPMGPPVTLRLSKEDVAKMCGDYGLVRTGEFDLGENLYCIQFEKT